MTELLADLIAARALIDKPERWTKGAFARDSEGLQILDGAFLHNEMAACFCLDGAIRMVTKDDGARRKACHVALMNQSPDNDSLTRMSAWHFNDEHTHAEVMELLDRAIQRVA